MHAGQMGMMTIMSQTEGFAESIFVNKKTVGVVDATPPMKDRKTFSAYS